MARDCVLVALELFYYVISRRVFSAFLVPNTNKVLEF